MFIWTSDNNIYTGIVDWRWITRQVRHSVQDIVNCKDFMEIIFHTDFPWPLEIIHQIFLVLHEGLFPYLSIRLLKFSKKNFFSVTVPHVRLCGLLSQLVCKSENILLTSFISHHFFDSYLLHLSTHMRHLCLNKCCQHSRRIDKLALIIYPHMLFYVTIDSIFYQLLHSLNY